jgi:hypothetical protein
MKTLLLIAQHVCRYRYASALDTSAITGLFTDDAFRRCVLDLCRMVTLPQNTAFSSGKWFDTVSANVTEREMDESSLDFRRHLLSAAAWIGEKSLVVDLVGDGCNYIEYP